MVDDKSQVPGLSFLLIRELQIKKHSFLILHLYSHPLIAQVSHLHNRCQLQGPFRAMTGEEGEPIIHELTLGWLVIYLIEVVILNE